MQFEDFIKSKVHTAAIENTHPHLCACGETGEAYVYESDFFFQVSGGTYVADFGNDQLSTQSIDDAEQWLYKNACAMLGID